MDMWMKVVSAIFLGLMIVVLLPRAKAMLENSPKPEVGDWRGALLPIAGVIVFVVLLMALV